MRRVNVALAAGLVAGLSALGGVAVTTTATAQPTPTWTANIGPLFATNCTSCHSGAGRAGLKLDTYANTIAGGNSGPALIAGNLGQVIGVSRVLVTPGDQVLMPRQGAAQFG